MKLTLREQLVQFEYLLQTALFPAVKEATGKLDEKARQLVATLEMLPLARFVPSSRGWMGRPSKDRVAIAAAFVAKAVYGLGLTRQLLERLRNDQQLRRICGWEHAHQMPHESTFSRAFAEFSRMELPQFVHEALVVDTQKNRLIGHIARDATAIEARERFPETKAQAAARKAEKKKEKEKKPKGKRGPRKGKRGPHQRHKGGKRPYQPKDNTRLHRQRSMSLSAMLAELPKECSLGVKSADDGNQKYWRGYKLHLDVADGQIPISAILTGAKLHDSQVAIPLSLMTAQRVTNLYDVMDAAYDATEIYNHSRSLGHVPIIRPAKRKLKKNAPLHTGETHVAREMTWAEEDRFRERTMIERVNARLKDEFGGREIRVRGASKIMAHLMFGLIALTVDQLLKLAK
jgi:hypothetical protein